MAPLLTCTSCKTLHPKTSYSKSQWAKATTPGGGGGATCSRCIYMEKNDPVDYQPPSELEDDYPLTPPGPEMRKVLEEGGSAAAAAVVLKNTTTTSAVVLKEEVDMKEEEGKSSGDGGGGTKGWINLKDDLKAPELKVKEEDPNAELSREGSKKRVQFKEAEKEIIIEEPKEEENEVVVLVKEEAVKEEVEETVKTEKSKEVVEVSGFDQDAAKNDDDTAPPAASAAAPVVVSFSEENPVEIYEDTIIEDEDEDVDTAPQPLPPEVVPVVVATTATTSSLAAIVESSSSVSLEESSSSSSGETESSADTEASVDTEEEEEEEEEDKNVAPNVAAAAILGAIAAGGAAASAKEEIDVETEEEEEEEEQEEENVAPNVAAAAILGAIAAGGAATAATASAKEELDVETEEEEEEEEQEEDKHVEPHVAAAAILGAIAAGGAAASAKEEIDVETEEEEEEENVAPYVAAAAVGVVAAGGAAAATTASVNKEEEELDVEIMGGDEPTETETANDASPPESPDLEVNDFSNPEEETGEQFNLANEEHRNEVVPPTQDVHDEEQGLQLNTEDTVAGAPLSPITEKSVETNDPSFASAATATKAADVANSTNDEEHQSRTMSSRSKSSCCKRHKCLTLFFILMTLFVIAAAVLIILFFFGPLKHPVSNESPRKGTSGLCDVWDLGPFYQTECETCSYTVAMDGDTGLIARGGEGIENESIQFLTNFGTYLPLQTLPFISHEESALLGNYAALGDPNADDGLGTVYIYERNSVGVWSDVWNITPETLNGEEAKFGTAIALSADKMVVGAPGDVNEASTGSVYVFGRGDDGNWVEEAKLYQPNVTTGNFGSAVALQGDTLVVADASFPGTVYVYQYDSTTNSWAQPIDGTLTSADCRSTFGISVGATDGGGVLIECPKDTTGAGAVYYYTPQSDGSGYELSQKITAFNEVSLPALGGKIVADKDRLLVTTDAKSAFVFILDVLGEWKEAASIEAPASANNFGADAALFGEHIFLSYDGNTHSYILDC